MLRHELGVTLSHDSSDFHSLVLNHEVTHGVLFLSGKQRFKS